MEVLHGDWISLDTPASAGNAYEMIAEPKKPPRPEQEIFEELAALCSSSGYIHAIAYLAFRDNMVTYSGEMKPEDMHHMFGRDRLIRTELSTLIGLLLKSDIDYALPAPEVMQQYVDKTEALLEEIHQSMSSSFWTGLDPTKISDPNFNPFTGTALREPIFYGGESAYSFQYRDFSVRKYARDDDWLTKNKGFSIGAARDIVEAVGHIQNEKSIAAFHELRQKPPDEWSLLPGFEFTTEEVAHRTGIDQALVRSVLNAFAVPDAARNESFSGLTEFNIANATPLIRRGDGTYFLFHIYSLVEALYEAPFYWMGADAAYMSTAMRNRGLFTEEIATERLRHVFGEARVIPNVEIYDSKRRMGEIDVLVLFGDRAIVLQAKSKRLTLEARRGNDGQIREDFKKSIQDSCDQAFLCAKLLNDARYTLKSSDSREVVVTRPLKQIYILCAVADHYPALSFQARQFLKFESTTGIAPPFVLDIFTLDAMAEMLESPLQLLSYIDRRAKYSDRLTSTHELTILSYHLKRNLWLDNEFDMVMLDDDISTDLDLAMTVRRDNIPGKRTPDGILTRLANTTLGRLTEQIDSTPNPATIDFGFLLLTLGEDTVIEVSKHVDRLSKQAVSDGKGRDVTVGLGAGDTGLTIHCNQDPISIAGPRLQRHCALRKYKEKATSWFGVCVDPATVTLRFGVNLDYPWEPSEEMELATAGLSKSGNLAVAQKKEKVGRNDPCPCGSGKKYKKCCGR